jgi:Tol biopolymer transport system component
VDLDRNVPVKLTDNPLLDAMPLWSPDGTRIIYASERGDRIADVVRTLDTGADEEFPLPPRRGARIVTDWSKNFMLYKEVDQRGERSDWDMWLIPIDGRGAPRPVNPSRFNERDGQISPDERWITYESDEQGQPEIFLQPLTGPGERIRMSTNGGRQVRWRPDGAALFYIAADDTLMSVPIDPSGPSGPAVGLFKTRIAPLNAISRQQYVVAADGKRFLINTRDPASSSPITLILNWKPPSPVD